MFFMELWFQLYFIEEVRGEWDIKDYKVVEM